MSLSLADWKVASSVAGCVTIHAVGSILLIGCVSLAHVPEFLLGGFLTLLSSMKRRGEGRGGMGRGGEGREGHS